MFSKGDKLFLASIVLAIIILIVGRPFALATEPVPTPTESANFGAPEVIDEMLGELEEQAPDAAIVDLGTPEVIDEMLGEVEQYYPLELMDPTPEPEQMVGIDPAEGYGDVGPDSVTSIKAAQPRTEAQPAQVRPNLPKTGV